MPENSLIYKNGLSSSLESFYGFCVCRQLNTGSADIAISIHYAHSDITISCDNIGSTSGDQHLYIHNKMIQAVHEKIYTTVYIDSSHSTTNYYVTAQQVS